jgi:hypothetical protein
MKSLSMLAHPPVQALAYALIMLIVSACGAPQATPTPIGKTVDVENTMIAQIATSLEETHAAVPTSTPPPTATLTNTPAASATPPALPTLGATAPAIPGGNPGTGVNSGDPCINKVLPADLDGKPIRIRIDNPTSASLMLSVNLQQSGPQSVCGYRSYTLAPGESLVINDLVEGCYTLWAWNPDPDAYFIVTNGTSCLDGSNSWTFDITTSSLKLRP